MESVIHCGDSAEVLTTMASESVDAIVTDPPAGIAFMGRAWDGDKGGRRQWVAWLVGLMGETLRTLKPGGHALVWALPRTAHWTACALEDAGFEIRDSVHHVFGTGWNKHPTQLKPAHEVWWVARKPFRGSQRANVERWGVGGLFIDSCRVATVGERQLRGAHQPRPNASAASGYDAGSGMHLGTTTAGRVPTNFVLSHLPECGRQCAPGCAVAEIGEQSGFSDKGTAARFFPCFRYIAKASRREREAGLTQPETGRANTHTTVKPIELMRWLCRLVTPPGGVVLDPFAGSGTTGVACALEGFGFIGIEQSTEYVEIARQRIAAAQDGDAFDFLTKFKPKRKAHKRLDHCGKLNGIAPLFAMMGVE